MPAVRISRRAACRCDGLSVKLHDAKSYIIFTHRHAKFLRNIIKQTVRTATSAAVILNIYNNRLNSPYVCSSSRLATKARHLRTFQSVSCLALAWTRRSRSAAVPSTSLPRPGQPSACRETCNGASTWKPSPPKKTKNHRPKKPFKKNISINTLSP